MKTDSILSKAEARVSRGYVEGLSGKEIAELRDARNGESIQTRYDNDRTLAPPGR